MKAIIIKQDRWDEIFKSWLLEVKERAVTEQKSEDQNIPRFIQYWVCDLQQRLERSE